MMKRVTIGLIAMGVVALWCMDASAQCPGGVGLGGSCVTDVLLGRSLAGITRSLDPGQSTFEFFGTTGSGCNHNFNTGVLDCNCRITGTAYCIPSGTVTATSSSVSAFNRNTKDDDDDSGTDLVPKLQTLPPGLRVNNLNLPAGTTVSQGGNPIGQPGSESYWAVAELEPPSSCVSCPTGTTYLTFLVTEVVMRVTFQPDDYEVPATTIIRECLGGRGLHPTEIESYTCRTVFVCMGEECPSPNTSGTCKAACEPQVD